MHPVHEINYHACKRSQILIYIKRLHVYKWQGHFWNVPALIETSQMTIFLSVPMTIQIRNRVHVTGDKWNIKLMLTRMLNVGMRGTIGTSKCWQGGLWRWAEMRKTPVEHDRQLRKIMFILCLSRNLTLRVHRSSLKRHIKFGNNLLNRIQRMRTSNDEWCYSTQLW